MTEALKTSYPIGARSKIGEFASAVTEDDGARLRGDYVFIPDKGDIRRMYFLLAFGDKLSAGAEAQGVTRTEDDHVIVKLTLDEADSEGWIVDGAGIEDGADVVLTDLTYVRVF